MSETKLRKPVNYKNSNHYQLQQQQQQQQQHLLATGDDLANVNLVDLNSQHFDFCDHNGVGFDVAARMGTHRNSSPGSSGQEQNNNIWKYMNLNRLISIMFLMKTRKTSTEAPTTTTTTTATTTMNGGGGGGDDNNRQSLYTKRPRLVKKNGELNIDVESVPRRKRRLLKDFFNTVLDIKWRWHVLIFVMTFLISWILFATVWYLIAYLHDDLRVNALTTTTMSSGDDVEQSSDGTLTRNGHHIHHLSVGGMDRVAVAYKFADEIRMLNTSLDHIYTLSKSIVDLNRTLFASDTTDPAAPHHHTTSTFECKPEKFNFILSASNMSLASISSTLTTLRDGLNSNERKQAEAAAAAAATRMMSPGGRPKNHTPCVHGIHDFTSALLYSVETQHTIGYGMRHITEECPCAILFLMIQSCFGIFVQALVAGVVFAKISRPNQRKQTIIFSHNAVVSERDGQLVFMFKIGNVRNSQLSDAKVRMLMIKPRVTRDGELIPFQTYDMKVGYDWSSNETVFFPWPKTVEHVIDSSSPLYEICKQQPKTKEASLDTSVSDNVSTDSSSINHHHNNQATETSLFGGDMVGLDRRKKSTTLTSGLRQQQQQQQHHHQHQQQQHQSNINRRTDYEIVVMLEGNIETTGASCHIRTSYLPHEILFGYRFTPIYPKIKEAEYVFDFTKFDYTDFVQPHLLHLNEENFVNKIVYDAKREYKNCQLTYQNTLTKADPPRSLLALLNAFNEEQTKANETIRAKITEETTESITEVENSLVLEMDDVDGATATKEVADTNQNTPKIRIQSPPQSAGSTPSSSRPPPPPLPTRSKCNGRFTVVPVQEKRSDNLLMSICRKRPLLKRIVTGPPNSSTSCCSKTARRQTRANSTPPAFIFYQTLLPIAPVKTTTSNTTTTTTTTTAAVNNNLLVVVSSNERASSVSSSVDDEGYSSSSKHAPSQTSTGLNSKEILNV